MKKILDLLEQKLQWIVLGLALLYAGYITYYYVVTPKVTVELGGSTLTPGDIDKFTLEGPGRALKDHIRSTKVVAPASAPSYVADFQAKMGYQKDSATSWPEAAVVIQQLPMYKFTDLPKPDGGPNPSPDSKNLRVADLIKLPPAKITVAPRAGLTTVLPPNAPAPAPGALVANAGVDKSWVTIRFEIDPKELVQAWDLAKIPLEIAGNTAFVQVVMERQELSPEGKWGPSTIVKTLPFITLLPFPAAGDNPQAETAFFDWAKNHQRDILQPDFYQYVKGDPWAVPGVAVAGGGVPVAPVFRAEEHLKDTQAQLLLLTPEQRREVANLRAKQAPPPRGATRGPAPRRGGPAAPAPAPAGDAPPEYNFGADTSTDRPVSFQAADANPALPPVDAPPGDDPAAAGNAPAPQQGNFPMPPGMFDPHKWTSPNPQIPNIVGWAHDETATPGQTYRYRITYRLKNPVYFANGFGKAPNIEKIFSIASPPSDWSANVRISSTINFFIAKRGGAANSVSADVFRKQGGAVKRKSFDVTAGDMIGGQDSTGVDYTTGFTMVDIREDPRTNEIYVLIMDPSGAIQRRDFSAEQKDENYKLLQTQSVSSTGRAEDLASR